jgi:hypothetical protein
MIHPHLAYLRRLPQVPAGPLPAYYAVPNAVLPDDRYDNRVPAGVAYAHAPSHDDLWGFTEPRADALRLLAEPTISGHFGNDIHHTVTKALTRDGFITTACKPDAWGPDEPREVFALTELGLIVARLLGRTLEGPSGPFPVVTQRWTRLQCRTCGRGASLPLIAWGLTTPSALLGDVQCVSCAYGAAIGHPHTAHKPRYQDPVNLPGVARPFRIGPEQRRVLFTLTQRGGSCSRPDLIAALAPRRKTGLDHVLGQLRAAGIIWPTPPGRPVGGPRVYTLTPVGQAVADAFMARGHLP